MPVTEYVNVYYGVHRNPSPKDRPDFLSLYEDLRESNSESYLFLNWDFEDKSVSLTASILGTSLEGAKVLYPDLQRQYRQEVEAVEVGEEEPSSHAPPSPTPSLSWGDI